VKTIRILVLAILTLAGLFIAVTTTGAVPDTIDLNSTSADLTVYGDDADDASGFSLATGDINGDGIDDLIIGAPYADPAGGTDAGETYVVYGDAGLPSTINLNSTAAHLTVYGDDSADKSGLTVAAGDINGDGIDDLIIGAPYADQGGRTSVGETCVIYGGPSLPDTIDLNSTSADLTVYGDYTGDLSGAAVAAGDIDGDGTADIIIGAYAAGADGRLSAGETYAIYGGDSLPATIDLNSTSADLTVYGDDSGDNCGRSLAVGNVNGDGADDLIVGALQADPPGGNAAGKTYVIYGDASLPATIDLSTTNADLMVFGDDEADMLSQGVVAGDINSDGTHDLIISASRADAPGGSYAGKTYVIYGGPSLPDTIDLNSTSADLTVYGDDAYDYSGHAVAEGDINGDGTHDLIVGAPYAYPAGGSNAGETYVIYGGPLLPDTIDLNSTSADLTVYGDDADDFSGYAVAAGDINGDGSHDLIVGAPYAYPAGGSGAGEVYVIYGEPPPMPPPAVGGVAEYPDVASPGGFGPSASAYALVAGLTAAALAALTAGAWYARRRWGR
jgi:hypothetical protein